jgi:hypothetical protein
MADHLDHHQTFTPSIHEAEPGWMVEYFRVIADSFARIRNQFVFEPTYVEPGRKFDGLTVFADGARWNPNLQGRGIYYWNSHLGAAGEWVMTSAAAGSNTFVFDPVAKTANFTAQTWTSYLIDTSAAAVTVTMPATPTAGDQISFCDLMGTFGTNNLTILGNGNNVMRTNGGVLNTDNWNAPFLFTSQGWLPASN